MNQFRRHQSDMTEIAQRIVAGSWSGKRVVAEVTPGGGKTRMSIILARRLLEAGMVDAVLHVVPRSALRAQVELDYVEHGGGFLLTRSENTAPLFVSERLPGGRVVGTVCSYAQITANPALYRDLMRTKRTLLVCDEAGLLADNQERAWGSLAMGLHELAAFTLVMSGTLFRRKKSEKVALVDYVHGDGSAKMPDLEKEYPKADIRYSLADAIGACAVKPMEFIRLDGAVKYRFLEEGENVDAILSEDDESDALRAFVVLPSTWQPLVDMGVLHWANWRREVYPSRMIIVAPTVPHASEICAYLRSKHGVECAQATSDLDDAHETIRVFQGDRKARRVGTPDILVTVAMASIGFDVPDCTHMVYLSQTRSLPWALQAFARATRIDPLCSLGAEFQTAFCFVPDDKRMAALIEWMRKETAQGISQRREPRDSDGSDGGGALPNVPVFIPLSSVPGAVTVDGRDGAFERDTSADVMNILGNVPEAAGIPPSKLAAILKFQRQAGDSALQAQFGAPVAPTVSPSDAKKANRTELETLSRLIDFRTKQSIGSTNRTLRGHAGKERHELTERELLGLVKWCKETLRHLPGRE